MIIQVHWQSRTDPSRTEFVAQSKDFTEADFAADRTAPLVWAEEVIRRRFAEMPDGWCPMVCTEDSEYFVRAAAPVFIPVEES